MGDMSSIPPVRGVSSPVYASLSARRPWQAIFWPLVALLSAFTIFVLPFAFPPPVPNFSTSYPYGFGNRVAELSTVCLSFAVLLVLWAARAGRPPLPIAPDSPADKMPRIWLLFASLAALLFTGVLGGFMVHANIFYSDASYFLTQIGRVLHDHAVLYRDVEFSYGPILFYLPAAIQIALGRFGISPAGASMVSLAIEQVAGLAMLFFILHWLPLSRRMRALALVIFTLGTLTPLLGMNYTFFRFLLPQALFLAVLRYRSLAAQSLLFAVAQLIALGFSPEIGLAMIGGAGCYALYRCFDTGWQWIAPALSSLAACLLFVAVMSKDYFSVMGRFAAGAFNLVVMPDYHILILLLAAIALSPIAVAGYLQTRDPRAAAMLGFFVISMTMLAPGLGRCDPLHTFFVGMGVYLLSLVAVSRLPTLPARVWVAALVLMVVGYQVDDFRVYKQLIKQAVFPHSVNVGFVDLNRLEALTHGQRIAAPVVTPQAAVQELIRLGQFEPSYYVFMGGVWDDPSELHKIAEMRRAPYALIPNWNYTTTHPDFEASLISRAFRFNYRYRRRFTPWVQGVLLEREIHDHWTPVGSVGTYSVYRQNGR
jgi:hypothetical protein